MQTLLYAQPYDFEADGFYFASVEDYEAQINTIFNDGGDPVEEFEIQFIDGEKIDHNLAQVIDLNQMNFRGYFECVAALNEWEKIKLIIAIGEFGYPSAP